MAEEQVFLDEIIANVGDDEPRLIYADWLEEQGDWRGELIRVQCELSPLSHDERKKHPLHEREEQLLGRYRQDFLELKPAIERWRCLRGILELVTVRDLNRSVIERLERELVLQLVYCKRASWVNWDLESLVASPLVSRLTRLEIIGQAINKAAMQELATHCFSSSLEFLALRDCKIDDEVMAVLTQCANLRNVKSLSLSDNEIGELGIQELARSSNLGSLRTLYLRSTKTPTPNSAMEKLIEPKCLPNLKTIYAPSNWFGHSYGHQWGSRDNDAERISLLEQLQERYRVSS